MTHATSSRLHSNPSQRWNAQTNTEIGDDGEYLILRRVRFENGRNYDIRIEKRDANGLSLLNQDGQFLQPDLDRIRQICVTKLFSQNGGVTPESLLEYAKHPAERLISVTNDGTNDLESDITTFSSLVEGARKIDELLIPGLKAVWSSDPNQQLLVRAKRTRSAMAQPASSPSASPHSASSTTTSSSAPSATTSSTSPSTSTSSTASSAPSTSTPATSASSPIITIDQLVEADKNEFYAHADQATETYSQLPTHKNSFLANVKFRELYEYLNSSKPKQPADKFYSHYKAIQELSKDFRNPKDKNAKQMKQWLQFVYGSIYTSDYHQSMQIAHQNMIANHLTPPNQSFAEWFKHWLIRNLARVFDLESSLSIQMMLENYDVSST